MNAQSQGTKTEDPLVAFGNYSEFLKYVETLDRFKSIKKLMQRIIRQRKELQLWQKGKLNITIQPETSEVNSVKEEEIVEKESEKSEQNPVGV